MFSHNFYVNRLCLTPLSASLTCPFGPHTASVHIMVSTRPSPTPARGRISYPTAATYTPGDGEEAPTMTGSHPMQPVTSQESSDGERTQGFKTWWKATRGDKMETPIDQPHVFGIPLSESIKYASVQISTAGADDKLYVWG